LEYLFCHLFGLFWDIIVYFFWKVQIIAVIMQKFFWGLMTFHWYYFWQPFGLFLQHYVCRQLENRQAIPERNVLKADVMVAPMDYIVEIIRDNHW